MLDRRTYEQPRMLPAIAFADLRRLVWWLIAMLPVVAAVRIVVAGVLATTAPLALDYAEPIIYGQAQRVISGAPLYQPIDQPPFTVTAYTPLYYVFAAMLQVFIGPGFGPGRAASLMCGIAAAIIVARLAATRGAAWSGLLGACLFLAFGFPTDVDGTPWLGLYRVDMLGVALSLSAILVLSLRTSNRALITAGALAGLAILCKPTFFGAFVAGSVWLLSDIQGNPRKLALFMLAGVLTVAVPCVLLEITTGAFVRNTIDANLNPLSLESARDLALLYVRTQWLPLALAAAYIATANRMQPPDTRLIVTYWLASSVSLLGIAKIGANHNYWIEFAATTAVLAGRGAAYIPATGKARAAVGAALALLLAVQLGGPERFANDLEGIRADTEAALGAAPDAEFAELVERVRAEPGEVLAEPMDVLALSRRPVLLEPFIYSILLDLGRWNPDRIVRQICRGDVRLLVLAYPLEVGASMRTGPHTLWPVPVMAALEQTMVLENIVAARHIYTPRRGTETTAVC